MTEGNWNQPEIDEDFDTGEGEPGSPSEAAPKTSAVKTNQAGQITQIPGPDGKPIDIFYSGPEKTATVTAVSIDGKTIPNNGAIEALGDGSLRVKDQTGTVVYKPDGTIYGSSKDNSSKFVRYADGDTVVINNEGYQDRDGVQWKKLPDGSYVNANNERLKSVSMYSNGTIGEENMNGTATLLMPDGSSAVVAKDGRASISIDPEGKVKEANMGATSWKMVDGQWKEINNLTQVATGRSADEPPTMDKDGNIIIKTSDGGKQIHTTNGATVTSDKNGKVTQVNYNDGTSRQFSYDAKGNVNKVVERDGHTWTKEGDQWLSDDGKHSNSQIVVLANGNMMVSSADGKTWEVRTASAPGVTKVLDK